MVKAPTATNDIEQAKHDLTDTGVCIIADAIDNDALAVARRAIYKAADDDVSQGLVTDGFALDSNGHNQRVWNLLRRHAIFASLAAHPIALALIRHVIGWPALLSNISGNIVGPGTTPGVNHADQVFVPRPWPAEPQGINVVWCLDDFNQQNGGTWVAPGSHLSSRDAQQDDMIPIEAPAGSAIAFESRIWHQTGRNTTDDTFRAGVFAFYTTPVYRTQENWFLSLDDQFLSTASDDLLTLLAYKSTGFGLVNGRSPR